MNVYPLINNLHPVILKKERIISHFLSVKNIATLLTVTLHMYCVDLESLRKYGSSMKQIS